MKSKYTSEKTNGTSQYVYTNDVYDLTINNTNGDLAPNLGIKKNDANTVIRQLLEDLSNTTLKLESLMNAFRECVKMGMIPEDVVNYLSTYVYGPLNDESKNVRNL